MSTQVLQPARPLAADDVALARVLKQAGVGKDDLIRVTGPAGLTAVLCLYRHGYERASYVHANWINATRGADALLIPHPCGTTELAAMIQGADCLREGGVLIVQLEADRSALAADSVPGLLRHVGYDVGSGLSEKGREVCIARRRSLPGFRKAA